jgi:hypothetical protein
MRRPVRTILAALLGVGLVPGAGLAFGGRGGPVVASLQPAPIPRVIVPYVHVPVLCQPAVFAGPGPILARPVPAPPSAGPVGAPERLHPPASTPALPATPQPGVRESREYFDLYFDSPRGGDKPNPDRATVGFWNVTDRDLSVKIGAETKVLLRGKSLTLELPRQFVWQVEGRAQRAETIPAENGALEIVIRQ